MKKTTKAVIITVIILLSIAVIVLTCLLVIKKVRKSDYYEQKCESFEVQNANLSKGQIVFIGDSITDLCKLDDYYKGTELALYNRGIGGDTTEGLQKRLQVSVFDIEPTIIVMMIGTNDISWGRSVKDITKTYCEIVEEIYTKLPNVKLYCMSVIPQNKDIEEYAPVSVDNNLKKINELNSEIQNLSLEFGFAYLDLYPLLLDEDGYLDEKYSDDGLHLNHNGFVVWSNLVKEEWSKE